MKLDMIREANKLTVKIDGQLDTVTTPDLEQALQQNMDENVTELVFDLEKMDYTSSAGLRVFLFYYQNLNEEGHGTLRLIHVNEMVMDVLKMTGLDGILPIE